MNARREAPEKGKALLIGNSDGIGLATTTELLKRGWRVVGISRSESPINDPSYNHTVADVRDANYTDTLKLVLDEGGPIDVCIYCVGVGEPLDLAHMNRELEIFEVNLIGMVRTASCVIPSMVESGTGHFIGLSSLADVLVSPEAPSYCASKAGFSNYLEGLALALRKKGVRVTNVRFGYVDTKMAKGDVRPFMMRPERAAQHLISCIDRAPIRYTTPWILIPLVQLLRWMMRFRMLIR